MCNMSSKCSENVIHTNKAQEGEAEDELHGVWCVVTEEAAGVMSGLSPTTLIYQHTTTWGKCWQIFIFVYIPFIYQHTQ